MKKELDSIKFPKRKSKRWKPSEIQLFLMAPLFNPVRTPHTITIT